MTPIRIMTKAIKAFEGNQTEIEVVSDLFFDSAPQVGLEPTTYGLTVRRSNQLSY
jgi:hypothetical protein